ncbi:hypothetical protein AMD27_08925 [Acinetobacter sp. TGL-Y2]|uniref:hypothetical protein n=1 Tax=Acinetobacter sp. TGL-Y2 TaxID=1407071 RepID=UPI0007A65C5E|nr:hypothetical protein [Acinetobacter sp. TGL-Y2]AMW78992.1 hypothetical protein AMD27_08925 [Acinetobacter sp. TGL-Y2]
MKITSRLFAFTLYTTPLFIPLSAYATVGGGQHLEFLGYEPKDQKLYVLRHFEDGRGRLPQLYYYQFSTQSTLKPQMIRVNSLYINPKTRKIDYDQDDAQFNQQLSKIKKRLKPLVKIKSEQIKLDLSQKSQKHVPSIFSELSKIVQYRFRYQLYNPTHQSHKQEAISYTPKIRVNQAYSIPHQRQQIATVTYMAFPEEGGYNTEEPVLLIPKK